MGSALPAALAPADGSVAAALERLLAASRRGLQAFARQGDAEDPESLHRFRIGLRRFRTLLATFRPVLPEVERQALDAALSDAACRYARARQWDVFAAAVVGPLRAALPDEPVLAELAAAAAAARRRSLPPGPSIRRDAAALDRAAGALAPAMAAGLAAAPLVEVVPPILSRRHRRVRKAVKAVDLADPADFHEVRLKAKRLRYAAELFRDLYDGAAVEAYLRRLVAVTDRLGELNDALAVHGLLAELAVGSRASGVVLGWVAREAEACRARFPKAARRFRRADPFWKS
jgi:CHAD domain-containing protein